MSLQTQFEKMGVRVQIGPVRRRGLWQSGPISINVLRDRKGEFFDLQADEGIDLEVIDCQPKERHLLLLARSKEGHREIKDKFLCGHDERNWFVAAVPDARGVSNVKTAKEALKPGVVRDEQAKQGVKAKHLGRRHTEAYIRQGEWFFIPRPNFRPRKNAVILRNEPITRGRGSKPHMCELLHRNGGEQVYVNGANPNGISEAQFQLLSKAERTRGGYRAMMADARVYVKGAIRHSDHKTIHLDCWHLVVMNTENGARSMRHVRFLD